MNAHGVDGAEELRQTSDRIERLLTELRGSTSPAAWARIEDLVSSMTAVYGRGLKRTLEIFAGVGKIDGRARAELCDDPLVESLLLLHGLHPAAVEERVARAVERVRHAMGSGGGKIDVGDVDSSGVLTVRLVGDWRRCPVPAAAVEAALRRAIEESAPDLERIAVERAGTFPASEPAGHGLVQIGLGRSRAAAAGGAR
jgi:Fe-S cluster biogenesis protein NfuA